MGNIKESVHIIAQQCAEMTLRKETPLARSKMQKSKDDKRKREEALLEANEKYETTDTKTLLSHVALELSKLGGTKNSKTQVRSHS